MLLPSFFSHSFNSVSFLLVAFFVSKLDITLFCFDIGDVYINNFGLLSSPKRGYGAENKTEIKSFVENTLTTDCFLNAFSLDQIAAWNERAKAK